MKKVLYGVALALFASVSVGSLQSCKDDFEDYKTQTSYDLTKLQSQLNDEVARLKGLIDQNAADIAGIKAEYAKVSYVNDKVAELKAAYEAADKALAEKLENQINGAISALDQKFATIETVENYKAELEGRIGANEAAIKELQELVPTLASKDDIEGLEALIRDTQDALTNVINLINDANANIATINQSISNIENAIEIIATRLDKQVSGILIQGVTSPVFGDFRIPLGVKNNIMFNWYGKNAHGRDITFPSNVGDGISATGDPGLDLATLKPVTYTVPNGYYGDNEKNVTLGKVYVTLNPVGAHFDHLDVTVENSKGDALPMTITLSPSEEILYHGYTRTEDNGFYEGVASMNVEDAINTVKYSIEDDLKVALKDAVKDPSKHAAKDLIKAVYDQLAVKVPAYGLRYSWNGGLSDDMDPGFSMNSYAVLSQYDLAVATAHPLSFNFLADYPGTSKKLPILDPISNFILKLKEDGDLHFKFDPITFNNVKITLPEIKITPAEVTPDNNNKVTVVIEPIGIYDENDKFIGASKRQTFDAEGVDKIVDDLAEKINASILDITSQIQGWSESANKDLTKQVQDALNPVADQINSMMESINGQIDQMIDKIGHKFDGLFNKANRLVDIYNKIAKKVNNILADPNAYLQATALYGMNGGYGFLSGNVNRPTVFKQAGGDAFSIFLTTYTGELIVPTCKKYVAVTGVYKNGKAVSADLASLNAASEDLNAVLDGGQIKVVVPAAGFTSGNVYEFTYQALDYSGYTSTKKFYIEVK